MTLIISGCDRVLVQYHMNGPNCWKSRSSTAEGAAQADRNASRDGSPAKRKRTPPRGRIISEGPTKPVKSEDPALPLASPSPAVERKESKDGEVAAKAAKVDCSQIGYNASACTEAVKLLSKSVSPEIAVWTKVEELPGTVRRYSRARGKVSHQDAPRERRARTQPSHWH